MSTPLKEKENTNEIPAKEQEYANLPAGAEEDGVSYMPEDEKDTATSDNASTQVISEQDENAKRDREILEALDEVIRRNSKSSRENSPSPKIKKNFTKYFAWTTHKGAGVITLALTLIFLGTVTLCVLASDSGNYALIARLSPAAAIFMGLELLIWQFLPGKAIRVNIPCTAATAVVVAFCCILSAMLNSTYIEIKEQSNEKHAAQEIYEKSYDALRRAADIKTLTVDVTNIDTASDSSEQSGNTDITIVFDGTYQTPAEFAQECRRVMDAYDIMEIGVMNYHFSAETELTSFKLDVEGLFQQDCTASELAELVSYYYIEDYDYISDLEDITIQTSSEGTSEN